MSFDKTLYISPNSTVLATTVVLPVENPQIRKLYWAFFIDVRFAERVSDLTVRYVLSSKWCLGGWSPLFCASLRISRLFLHCSAIFSNLKEGNGNKWNARLNRLNLIYWNGALIRYILGCFCNIPHVCELLGVCHTFLKKKGNRS